MHLGDHNDIGIMIADKPGGGTREESAGSKRSQGNSDPVLVPARAEWRSQQPGQDGVLSLRSGTPRGSAGSRVTEDRSQRLKSSARMAGSSRK